MELKRHNVCICTDVSLLPRNLGHSKRVQLTLQPQSHSQEVLSLLKGRRLSLLAHRVDRHSDVDSEL